MKRIIVFICLLFLALGLMAQTAVQPAGEGTEANPYQIATWQNLYWLSQNSDSWDKHFIQTADINFTDATPAIENWSYGTGWTAIGNSETQFTGIYDGDHHTITGLFLQGYYDAYYHGLFGWINTSASEIKNLGLLDVDVSGSYYSGMLVGYNHNGMINNCYSSGSLYGGCYGGGLVGYNKSGTISNCYNTGTATGSSDVGGLTGVNENGTINNCYSIGIVTGYSYEGGVSHIGGLVGFNSSGNIFNSYSTGPVNGSGYGTGGLVGHNLQGNISNCFSRGNVIGGDSYTGGLVGSHYSGNITNCYSAGFVDAVGGAGGLVGFMFSNSIVSNSFWDIDISGLSYSSGGTGLTTIEMKDISTYTNAGWTFPNPWSISPEINQGYPYLNYEAIVSIDDVTIETPLQTKAVLYSAYPNPFNPSTTISFDLVKLEMVKIDIYNVKGQIVKQLVNKAYDKGKHSLVWDGKDTQNNNCGTGVYFYRMTAGKTTQTKKMMMMK